MSKPTVFPVTSYKCETSRSEHHEALLHQGIGLILRLCDRLEVERCLSNCVENSHLPFGR